MLKELEHLSCKTERSGTLQPGGKVEGGKAQGHVKNVHKYLMGESKEVGARLAQLLLVTGQGEINAN